MIKRLLADLPKQHVHLGSFLLRIGLAIIFITHGYLKLVQDYGRTWNTALTPETQMAVAWGEMVCGCALLIGLLSRLAAAGLAVIMIGAIRLQTGHLDFIYTNFRPANDRGLTPTGAEYNFALIVMCLAVVAIGSGTFSVDRLLFRRKGGSSAT